MIRGLVIGLATLFLLAGAQAQTLPLPHRHHRVALSGRRHQRHHCARPGAETVGALGPERRHREQAGCQRRIGVNQVVRADPDGHTLLAVASSALTLNPIFYKSLSYDVARDLAPITRTGR